MAKYLRSCILRSFLELIPAGLVKYVLFQALERRI